MALEIAASHNEVVPPRRRGSIGGEGKNLLRFPIGLWVQYQVDKPICLWGGIEAWTL